MSRGRSTPSNRAASAGASLAIFAELAFEWFHPQRPPAAIRFGSPRPCRPDDRRFRRTRTPPRHGRSCSISTSATAARVRLLAGDRCRRPLLGRTRMIHITDYACFHEQGYYTPGDTGAPVYDTKAGRIGVAICYDRHYPEYMRALGDRGRGPRRRAAGGRGGRVAGGTVRSRDCASPRFRTATTPRSAIASARRTA